MPTRAAFVALVSLALSLVGCGAEPDPHCVECAGPPPGCSVVGASCTSCGTLVCEDGGGPFDASMPADASVPSDAAALEDATAGGDAAAPSDAGGPDASTQPDAGPGCPPPVCPAPPAGCEYAGGSACDCGALLCPSGPSCGGLTCAAGDYCATGDGSCDPAAGTCAPRPEICPDIFMPVCGCDGRTYSNACDANAAGASVAFPGECPADCRTTGCPTGSSCQGCRGPRGGVFTCIPDGAVC